LYLYLAKIDKDKTELNNWSIFIFTSNISGAGTDANVYLQIHGTQGATQKIEIEKNKELFESGRCDRFDRKLPNIGKPVKVKIGHDNTGFFPGWHLDKVNMSYFILALVN
jgi:hypothetical protein